MEDYPSLAGHQVYACGAPVMIDAARKDFVAPVRPARRGVLLGRLHLLSPGQVI